MKNTGNYKLKKPEGTDTVNIEDLNYNADIIDNELVKRALKTDMPTNLNQFTNGPGFITATGAPVQSVNGKTGTLILSASDVGAETPIGSQAKVNTLAGQVGNINDANLPVELKGKPLTEQTKVLFQNADNGKKNWVDVIGSPLVVIDTFSTLKDKTQTVKNTLASNLTNKGQTSTGVETLTNLVNKVGSISKGQGNAVENQVLSGVTFTNSDGILRTGTISNNAGSKIQICGYEDITEIIPHPEDPHNQSLITGKNSYNRNGYIDSNSQIQMSIAGLVPENIRSGVIIGRMGGKGSQIMVGTMQAGGVGITSIVGSSHSKENAACDIPQIRLEFYNRIFMNNIDAFSIIKNDNTNVWWHNYTINTTNSSNITDVECLYLGLTESFYPGTKYKVVIQEGALKDKFGNPLKAMEYEFRTNPNPSVWVINPAGLNVARYDLAGCGTQNAGLSFGGMYNGRGDTSTEKFNGNVWSTTGYLNLGRYGQAGCGTQDAALSFGGYGNSTTNVTEKFNGSTWTNVNFLITSIKDLAGCGTQDAALSFGGNNVTNITEKFNGNTWSSTGNLNTARRDLGGCGTQNAGLSFGGYENSTGTYAVTEKFDGNIWSSTGKLNVGRYDLAGCGAQDAALSFGCYIGNNRENTTEKFNGNTWSLTGNLNVGKKNPGGCGTQSVSLSFGGSNNTNGYLSTTEKFFG